MLTYPIRRSESNSRFKAILHAVSTITATGLRPISSRPGVNHSFALRASTHARKHACTVTTERAHFLSCVVAENRASLEVMTKVISFVNTKGGVGKSFLSVHMGVWLSDAGYRVAFVDADDQRTSSKWLGDAEGHRVDVWVLEGATEEKRTDEMRILLNDLRGQADFVVIDTKGSAGLTTSAAVVKSDLVCVPLQPSASDLWPIENSLTTIRLSQEVRGGQPRAFLVLNQTADSDVLARDVRKLAEQFAMPMARTSVKRLTAYRDAPGLRQFATRLTDARGLKAAVRLGELFEEVLNGLLPVKKEVANG